MNIFNRFISLHNSIRIQFIMFTHYLVTRFNIKISEKGPERINPPALDDPWLKDRFDLFMKFCLPSVLAQRNKNFTWLIYFDEGTPSAYLDQFSFLKQQPFSVELILVDHFTKMITHLTHTIQNSENTFIISSRLDNDDAISDQFIEKIQTAFVPHHHTVINFTSGYVLDLEKRVFTKWRNKLTNQFSSIIEDRTSANILTIYGFPHWRHPASATTLNIQSRPCWIEIIHQKNNRGRSLLGIPVYFPKDLNSFPEEVRNLAISYIQTAVYTIRWFPKVIIRRTRNFFTRRD